MAYDGLIDEIEFKRQKSTLRFSKKFFDVELFHENPKKRSKKCCKKKSVEVLIENNIGKAFDCSKPTLINELTLEQK